MPLAVDLAGGLCAKLDIAASQLDAQEERGVFILDVCTKSDKDNSGVMDEGDDGTWHDDSGGDNGDDDRGGDDVETMREWGDGADFSGATRLALRHEVESRTTMNKSEGIKKPETGSKKKYRVPRANGKQRKNETKARAAGGNRHMATL